MPDIQVPGWFVSGLQILLAFVSAFGVALWLSLIVWTFRDARSRSRDAFAILLATLMTTIFGPLGLVLYYLLRPQVTLAELYERALEEEALLQDLEEKPRCSGCSRVVENHWIVCPDCHTQLKRICQNCDEKLNLRWNICPSCGTGVNQVTPLMQSQNRNHVHAPKRPIESEQPAPPIETSPEPIPFHPETPAPAPFIEAEAVEPVLEADAVDSTAEKADSA